MATPRERSLSDSEEGEEVTVPLSRDFARKDLWHRHEEVVHGDIGDSNQRPNSPWPRFVYSYK